jgi:hypothetical protein
MGYGIDKSPVRIGAADIICAWIVVAVAVLILALSGLAIGR